MVVDLVVIVGGDGSLDLGEVTKSDSESELDPGTEPSRLALCGLHCRAQNELRKKDR